ncbi:Thiol-disulfide isomerase or thioredoxin [Pustulibacterium marinum]|uniref:Thiol-disulfide isomerase or thioredoxin n=2 Tax=Pustulibacterium marinum TaxID=1224947 RepID=A0A1I7IE80_9FLAO|nr:Thiol-disulfide isomerase or thioredoxin [Pustulibacterium marinum]
MKKIFLSFLTVGTLLVSCDNTKSNEYQIAGDAPGLKDGAKLVLSEQDSLGRPKSIDTAVVKDGKFKFTGTSNETKLGFLSLLNNRRGSAPIILEGGDITVEFNKDTIIKSVIKGTPNNDDFAKVLNKMSAVSDSINGMKDEMRELSQNKNFDGIKVLQEKRQAYQEELSNYEINFSKENPDSYVSILLLEKNLMMQKDEFDKLASIFDNLNNDLKNSEKGKKLEEQINSIRKTKIGAVAPDFSAKTLEGENLSLNAAKGKVTLIDFWASWCVPCRKENPNVLKIYNAYHKDGLNILGVSVDKAEDKWKEAVAADHINWQHVISQDAARTYNITQIPTTFLLNEKGEIVKKNLRGAELEAAIAEALGVANKNVVTEEAGKMPIPNS